MTREKFDRLVRGIERSFGSRPLALRARIALMLVLGAAGFASWLLILLALSVVFLLSGAAVDSALGVCLLAAGAVLLLLGMVQAAALLLVEVEPIRGRTVELREAPALQSILARLRQSLGMARFDQVVITTEFNAGVVLLPRLGMLGLSRRVLRLGLPLLETLSPEEFEAVLAHEFFHLSARHGRFATWIYWQRQSWERMFQRLQQPASTSVRRLGRWLMKRFVDWFWPRFNALAFVLSRTDEFAADRFSAEWAGPDVAAAALWRIECQNFRMSDEFWKALSQLATIQRQPPADLIDRLLAVLNSSPDAADAGRWMQQAAVRLTDNLDTHPGFSDRVESLGRSAAACAAGGYPPRARPSAAEAVLGAPLADIRKKIAAIWQTQLAATWWQRHSRSQSLQQRLADLDHSADDDDSGANVLWEQARATWDVGGPAAAEPLLRRLVDLQPRHWQANLALGQILVDRGQAEGEMFLLRILDREDEDSIPSACEVLANYYRADGQTDRLQEVRRRLGLYEAAAAAARQERSTVSASDRFIAHDLSAAELASLQNVLGRYSDLGTAFLARKQLKHFPRKQLFVLAVRSRCGFWTSGRSGRDLALASGLVTQVHLPGRVLVVAPQGGFRALARRVMRVRDGQVYPLTSPIAASGDQLRAE